MANKVIKTGAKREKDQTNNEVVCAVLAYLVVGIIWFFADENMRKNSFAKFHVKQALVLLVISVIVSVALSILGAILVWIPVLGLVIISILWAVYGIGCFILLIFGIINALTSKQKALPVIGGFADMIKF
jgi:uncharacterized membrane protein